jgi:hypothetical protein
LRRGCGHRSHSRVVTAVYGSTQTYEESKSALSNNFRREERYYWSETDADVDLRHLC